MDSARNRFIVLVTTGYALAALAWIFLSDRVLAIFANIESMVWLSTAKGVFFVAISAAAFFMALRSVPDIGKGERTGRLMESLAEGIAPGRLPAWAAYSFAVLVSVSMAVVSDRIAMQVGGRPMLIPFGLPIIFSALIGGLGPGLTATAIAVACSVWSGRAQVESFDVLQWGFLVANGLAVSILSEVLRRSLARSEMDKRLFDAVISGTSDAVFVKDSRGRYVLVNEAAAGFVGKTRDEIIGRDDLALFPEASARDLMTLDRAIMAGGKTQTHEEQVRTFDGRELVFLVTKGPVVDARGRGVGLFGISRDITGRKEAEDEIQRLNGVLEKRVGERTAELQAVNRELEDLAYALTHNLRAPLRAIGGFAQLLREENADAFDDAARDHLAQIMRANADMATMIDGILVLLRCARKDLDCDTVSLSALASQRLQALAGAEPQRRVAVVVEPGLEAEGDPVLLEMAMAHLVDNAWKFTRDRVDAEVRVSAGDVDGQRGVCVSDNGAGFDMAHAERLFQPFQRLHRQDEYPGPGIGLATVRRIISRHGGVLRARGAPGAGASFCFALPAAAKDHGDLP